MTRWFQFDARRATLFEDVRLAGGWRVVFLWYLRATGQGAGPEDPLPYLGALSDFDIDGSARGPEAQRAGDPILTRLGELGFGGVRHHEIRSLRGRCVLTRSVLLGPGGLVAASCVHVLSRGSTGVLEAAPVTFMSRLDGQRRLFTTSQARGFSRPSDDLTTHLPGASTDELLRVHLAELARDGRAAQVRPFLDVDEVYATWQDIEDEGHARNLARGLVSEVPEAEVARLLAEAPAAAASPSPGKEAQQHSMDDEVLARINEIQAPRINWRSALGLAGLSLGAFVALGGLAWSWRAVFLITVVLTVHEAGHLIAMRWFGYRDLRLLFVPLLGAVAIGQRGSVATWKRVVVSLAGPLPGIALGFVACLVGSDLNSFLLLEFALIAFLLNGLNLLPILPLDGGCVVADLVTVRRPTWEPGLRIVAAIALVGAATLGHGYVWAVLAVPLLLGLGRLRRLAHLATSLSREGLVAAPDAEGRIPEAAARTILRAVRAQSPGPSHSEILAADVVHVAERVSQRPPGLLATGALLAVLPLGLAGAWFGVQAVQGTLWEVDVEEEFGARLAHDSTESWSGPGTIDTPAAARVLIVHAESEAAAAESVPGLRPYLARGERLTRFGQTVFVATDASLDSQLKWVLMLTLVGDDVIGDVPPSEGEQPEALDAGTLSTLECTAPDEASATALVERLEVSLDYGWPDVRPEWIPPPSRVDAATAARQASARNVVLAFTRAGRGVDFDPEVEAAVAEVRETDMHQALVRRIEVTAAVHERRFRAWATAAGLPPDDEVARLVLAAFNGPFRADEASPDAASALRERLGTLRFLGRLPAEPEAWLAPSSGYAIADGRLVTVGELGWQRIDLGLPLLAAWLEAQGCTDQRHGVR